MYTEIFSRQKEEREAMLKFRKKIKALTKAGERKNNENKIK